MNNVVMIKLDKDRELRFGHKAMKKIESILGKPLMKLDMNELTSEQLETLYVCGLNDDSVSSENITDIMDVVPYNVLIQKLTEAVMASFGLKPSTEQESASEDKKK